MPIAETLHQFSNLVEQVTPPATALRALGIIALALVLSSLINQGVSLLLPQLARLATRRPGRQAVEGRLKVRRVETFFSVGLAIFRAVILSLALYISWRLIMPSTAPLALVGASAFFAVMAGGTLVPLLRSVTYGTMMIGERWYNVGDFVEVPMYGFGGVVEQVTLHSTKLQGLSGDVMWIHNAHMEGVRVVSQAVRTIVIDIFVDDLAAGKRVIEQAIQTLPAGPTMVARQLEITDTEELGPELWRISAVGATTMGREWLLEDFALKAIKKYDAGEASGGTIVHGPIVHYADSKAERRFTRSVMTRS